MQVKQGKLNALSALPGVLSMISIGAAVFFQNQDDKQTLVDLGLLPIEKTVLINGSGVNLDYFTTKPLPEGTSFLYIGRLLNDKGVGEYLEASIRIKQIYGKMVRCLLVGPFDSNPSALSPENLATYLKQGVEYFGEQTDVRPFIANCNVYVLPSYHEGTPKTVLEAMAMGRPIITTNAPGCRETVIEGINGFLVPIKNIDAIVAKMKRFIDNPGLAEIMGAESRRLAEEKFDVRKVNRLIMKTMGI